MRRSEPALGDRRVRIDGALEHEFLQIGRESAQHDEQVGVAGGRGDEQLECRWACDLGFRLERRGEERYAVTHRIEAQGRRVGGPFLLQEPAARIEVESGPSGARERPFVLLPLDEPVRVPHLQAHARLPVPAVFPAVQEMIEEGELQLAAVVRIEVRPVLQAVRLEPFLLGGRAHEAFEVAARVQALPAPVGGRKKGHPYLRPDGRALLVILVVEGVLADFIAKVAAIARQLCLRQCARRPAHQAAVHTAAPAALAGPVLHRLHLHVVPILPEGAEDAAMVRHVAIPVGRAFPDAHGGKMWRLQRSDVPLVDCVVGDSVEADLAVAPGLCCGPFDAVVEVLGLARRKMIDEPRRASAPARIEAHAGVVVRHPLLRVDHFPILVVVAGMGGHIGMPRGHAIPGARIAVLEGETLAIGAVAQDDRIAAFLDRPKNVAAQDDPVVHGHRRVPGDAHPIAHLGASRLAGNTFTPSPRLRTVPRVHEPSLTRRPSLRGQRVPADYGSRPRSANPIAYRGSDFPAVAEAN